MADRWDATLAQIMASWRCTETDTDQAEPSIEDQPARLDLDVLTKPISRFFANELRRAVMCADDSDAARVLSPELVLHGLREQLNANLARLVERTLALELNVAAISGDLAGTTGSERFQEFLGRFREPSKVAPLWDEYPVLARLLVTTASQRARALEELLAHLLADMDAIEDSLFDGVKQGKVVRVTSDLGDCHRRGRTVSMITFESGNRVVYKPRSMKVDVHFYELVAWLNEKNPGIQLKSLRVVERGDHGWVEYVVPADCQTHDELRRFYRRQGACLALLYGLAATDIHRENLIAAGEHPIIVDLESLFHPRPPRSEPDPDSIWAGFRHTVDESVLATGLLPAPLGSNQLDLSGLAGRAEQLTPHKVLRWKNAGRDDWHFVRDHAGLTATHHAPTLGGDTADVSNFVPEILSGFRSFYELLKEHRDNLVGTDGFLSRFADDEVRVVLRSTQVYGVLLQESCHPDMLRDASERDRLFDELWLSAEREPHLAQVVTAEQGDLRHYDVPIFRTRPASRDLWTAEDSRISDFLSEPSLIRVYRRLRMLSDRDLARQSWLLEASLRAQARSDWAPAAADNPSRLAAVGSEEDGPTDVESRLLALAVRIGHRLALTSIEHNGSTFWLTVGRVDRSVWRIEPCGTDLYGGLSGIALFLAYLGKLSCDERIMTLAQSAAHTLATETSDAATSGLGLFTGITGSMYALTHLATALNDEQLLEVALARSDRLAPFIDSDQDFDIVDGCAGCVVGLLPLYQATGSRKVLQLVTRCGDRLVSGKVSQPVGVGWQIRLEPDRALAGLAHGVAGIAWALAELWSITGQDKFRNAAVDGMAYERSLFCPSEGNWKDLRENQIGAEQVDAVQDKFMASWCHGAPGVGMARIATLDKLELPGMRDEIDAATFTTRKYGFGGNHCLCHGDLGNVELLLHARDKMGSQALDAEIESISNNLIRDISQAQHCGIPLPVETPGLMLGLAGIGWGLLRLMDTSRVPSVLLAEAPLG